ncbi:molybdate ABC transporter substrate-binding protein [Agarivorans sp. QJM3NY_33]|uniref:molybdate ABC transporter substrate-binding protein n=1 Tax=Agarivorans sp. QJM3NY_33 TaxID=3421432 RepID=UPI003D7D4C96
MKYNMSIFKTMTLVFSFLLGQTVAFGAYAEGLKVAVAGNFYKPLLQIAAQYHQDTGHRLLISTGSTGKLYAQIRNGAPFEFFMAADQVRPSQLVAEGMALADSQFTYAQGRLVLWSNQNNLVDQQGKVLNNFQLPYLAISNPKTAPYGAASVTVLKNLGLYQQLQPKLVEGQSVGQTFQQVSSGAAPLGFVALSQVYVDGEISHGSAWIVPSDLYQAIKQDAVILKKGEGNPQAKAFLSYLQTPPIQALIKSFGYQVNE